MTFTKGDPNINRKGRIDGGYSITALVRKALQSYPPKQKKTYGALVVERILNKAVFEGDVTTLKSIWAYMDGLPPQSIRQIHAFADLSDEELKNITVENIISLINDNNTD